ncbi:MAG: polysaccharide deacetylase family protein [Bacteriovoracaceae bacterium]|jgi:peptidoglycan-N-acetylglucosamine deacetylase|nr:polysaccharide deacetylase family protein [Bacteriovoracaceae bacterium]
MKEKSKEGAILESIFKRLKSFFHEFKETFFAPCIKTIPNSKNKIFLTFDDGPNEFCTPLVLELLKKHQVCSTFFLVGKNIESTKDVATKMIGDGHGIGNHSYDHHTLNYFKGVGAIKRWISGGEQVIRKHLNVGPIGFRPPVGIRTPELKIALRKLKVPLIGWNIRFYDTLLAFDFKRSLKKIENIRSGDIILMHDSHRGAEHFVGELEKFIVHMKERGFEFGRLSDEYIQRGSVQNA